MAALEKEVQLCAMQTSLATGNFKGPRLYLQVPGDADKKNSDRKASSLMVAFSCLTINLHIGKHVVSFTSKIVPHPDIRTFFTLKMGTVHNGTYFHSLSLLSVMSTSFSLFSLSLSFECNLPPPAF